MVQIIFFQFSSRLWLEERPLCNSVERKDVSNMDLRTITGHTEKFSISRSFKLYKLLNYKTERKKVDVIAAPGSPLKLVKILSD